MPFWLNIHNFIIDNIKNIFETTVKNCGLPLERVYHIELDTYDLLIGDEVTMYRMIIGCANWRVTLGRFDVDFYVSTMDRYNAAPSKVHRGTMLRIFGYFKHHMKLQIICDNSFM